MTPPVKSSKIAAAVRVALLSTSPLLAAHAATLPIPCTSGACGPGVSSFVTYGAASVAQAGSKLTINQTSADAILNWQSFNISADGIVQFVQPSASSVALNEIFDSNPTQIFGALDANGRVFLINQNGIIFGQGAQVNVGGLVASTLNLSPLAATTSGNNTGYHGLALPGQSDMPAFEAATDANGSILSKDITVQQSATIQAADGGEIYMFASHVTNLGTIHTPDGQTILAAGSSVYLAQSNSSDLRGVLVEVEGSGMVTNGLASNANAGSPQQLVGQVIAEHGNISLAALAVNQYGRVSANTSVNENGSIYLEAQNGQISANVLSPGVGGTLVLGQNSDTEVSLDTSDSTQTVDSVAQPKSTIQLSGATIQMLQGSVARATSGVIDVTTAENLGVTASSVTSDGSRFYMAPDAVLDVSGASITLPVSDNLMSAQLEATELENSPLQRNGPLHGRTVNVDIRTHGTNADGTTWWGTPVANLTGEIQAITRNVVERNLTGGTVNIRSQGDVILAPGSSINVSGGYIQYTGGYIDTSQLLTLWGQTVPIGSANPDIPYAGVVNSSTTTDAKWGVKQTYQATPSYYSPGYVEGKDAGALDLSATAFIMDGTVNASTPAGVYQTQPTTAPNSSTWVPGSLYRPYDEVPNGATLQIGTPGGAAADLLVNNVTLSAGEVLPGLQNADGSAFDPLTDPLPQSLTTSSLQPALVNEFDHVSIYTNGNLVLPPGTDLSLSAGGSFSAQAASIDIEGGIDVPSGTISLTAEPTFADGTNPETSLTLGAAASLTATGQWINDSPALYPNGNSAPLYIKGGSISLTAADPGLTFTSAVMQLDPGSLIDVSGGAQLASSNKLNAGGGGSITINAGTAPVSGLAISSPLPPPQVVLGATLRGYGLYEGGSLSISVPGICIAASDCSGGTHSVLWLTPGFFGSGGFSSYALTGDQGGLDITPGTVLDLTQQNLALPAGYTRLPDAATLIGMAAPVQLPMQVRQPVNLSLALEYPDNTDIGGTTVTDVVQLTSNTPTLTIPQDTVISTDPGGSLSLSSNTRLDVEGALRAPGGAISLTLNGQELQYDPSQGIWLGSNALLDASGVAKVFPNSIGNPTGMVLPGGTVSVDAGIGYLELLPGSLIDVSGGSGTLDLTPVGGGLTQSQQIASAGGVIDLFAADGAVIGGTLKAAAGVAGSGANQPAGGTLSLTVDPHLANLAGAPKSDVITVSPTLAPTVIAPGAAVPSALFNQALLPASVIQQGGFSVVALKSYLGNIDLSGGATLSATTEVSLDSQTYSVDPGTTGTVEAPYVELGSTSTPWAGPPAATGGTGVLDVSGGFIELYGTSSLQGIGTASFNSTGDLRVRGLLGDVTDDPTGIITGALYASGTIDLTAQQIYPTTLTQFTISADPSSVTNPPQPTSGAIVIKGSPGRAQDVLSAAGALTLSAASITQDGVLRAPFGTLTLDAISLTLGAGSLTSTSADGLTIPFGTTQGGLDWVYPLGSNLFTVYGTDGTAAPPAQNVALNGTNIDVASGAVIDISGGGDLQAYEWVPGPGGTQDVLGGTQSFAIVPSLRTNVAPYDPSMSAGSPLQAGEAVYLAGGSGVPAGTYVLLPARYALLPGAYLVTPMSGTAYQDMQPGQTLTGNDGGTIVAGYQTTMGLSYASSRWNGFDVTPPSIFMNEAQYTVTSGNQFFSAQETAANAAAANTAVSAMRLPQDAGVLELIAGSSLTLDGTLRTTAQSGARGAEVDISNPDIVVAGDTGAASQPGALVLTAASLNQLGAQTLLIGGSDGNGTITTTAQTLTVLGGASLSAPQILLTAQNQISIQSGASLAPTGSAPATGASYSLSDQGAQSDGGAFLSVSAGPQITVTRTGPTDINQGVLDLATGSSLTAGTGSVYLDATGGINTNGSIALSGGNLAIQAPQIALGNAPSGYGGAAIGQNILGTGELANLTLILSNPPSSSGIEVYGGTDISAQNITIDAPGLASQLTDGQSASLSATDTLTLGNSQATSISGTGQNVGSFTLSASDIDLGNSTAAASGAPAPTFGIDGFSSVALDAQKTVTAQSNIGFSTDSALTISASRITTAAGVSASVTAAGALAMLSPSSPSTLAAATAFGGRLNIAGATVELATQLALPSGNVTLSATGSGGDITVDSGGAINVAGVVQQYATQTVATPGSSVALSSQSGTIDLASGSSVDVSAGSGGVGGSLSLSAPMGSVLAQGALAGTGAQQGGSFSVDAQSFDFGALGAEVNAGGFTGAQSYRLRGGAAGGPTDLVLASGQAITAHDVLLESDSGNVDIEGNVDASGTSGGQVTLATAGTLTLNGLIDASATSPGGNGGTVELDLTGPGARLALGSNWGAGGGIDVSGGGSSETGAGPGAEAILPGIGGSVLLRVPDAAVTTVAAGLQGFAGTGIRGASSAVLEDYQTVSTQGDLSIDATAISGYQAMAQSIMSRSPDSPEVAAVDALNAGGWGFTLEPGIEVDATGSITVNATWDLSSWRSSEANGMSDIPGILTLRAGGGVTFNDSLSDGFTSYSQGASAGTLMNQNSWSYRIVAGADMTAADPLAVTATPADVTIGSSSPDGVLVRAGTGFIDVAASGNFILGNASSVLYTAGSDAGPSLTISSSNGRTHHNLPDYSLGGGTISIDAGGDIVGAAGANQFVNAWLWRGGLPSSGGEPTLAWSVSFDNFQQGVAALGGGNVTVRAGGDIADFSASIASMGMPQGGSLDVEGGGELTVSAGGNISGGSYYIGLGRATLSAGGSVEPSANTSVAPLIGLGDASVSITADGDITVADIVSPTLLSLGASQSAFNPYYFSTYGSASSASLVSVGGSVNLPDEFSAIGAQYGASFVGGQLGPTDTADATGDSSAAEVFLPPVLGIEALSGDANINRDVTLFPSSRADLQVLAAQDITIGVTSGASTGSVQVVVPDADPATMPTVATPIFGSGASGVLASLAEIATPFSTGYSIQHGSSPLYQSVSAFDQNPVTLVTATGDISVTDLLGQSGVWSGKPVIVSAGQDVVDFNLVAQNLTPGDVTAVSAGRDVIYPQGRSTGGVIEADDNGLVVAGPGELQVAAGRNVDLGTSNGITTIGSQQNTALSSGGAGVSVEAGIGYAAPTYTDFIHQYIAGSTQFDQQLIAYVEQVTGQNELTSSEAEQLFDALPAQEQRAFVEQLFFSLLKTYGEDAAKSGNNAEFAGAYAAIQQLFPGANPDLSKGETDPYSGSISLYFSRISTETGGDISLLAPGGEVNAGLALAPVSYGLNKSPQQLGIVVAQTGDMNSFSYSDFQVNESRVFSADGGNILVWSTEGNIDAGRGSKTSLSAAAPTANYDINGFPSITYFPPTTGSGIQALADTPGVSPGSVDLFAPHGVVNANDAGIVAGNLTIAATAVLGANNISASGVEVGMPVAVTGLGTQALAGSTSAAGATNAAQSGLAQASQQAEKEAPQATAALRWLDVFVLGFGEETCSANDLACLKRQKQPAH